MKTELTIELYKNDQYIDCLQLYCLKEEYKIERITDIFIITVKMSAFHRTGLSNLINKIKDYKLLLRVHDVFTSINVNDFGHPTNYHFLFQNLQKENLLILTEFVPNLNLPFLNRSNYNYAYVFESNILKMQLIVEN